MFKISRYAAAESQSSVLVRLLRGILWRYPCNAYAKKTRRHSYREQISRHPSESCRLSAGESFREKEFKLTFKVEEHTFSKYLALYREGGGTSASDIGRRKLVGWENSSKQRRKRNGFRDGNFLV